MQSNLLIREILLKENMTLTQLAQKLDVSIYSLSNKLNRQSMKYSDVQQILHVLGYELVARKKDTPFEGDTLLDIISSKVMENIKDEIVDELGLSLDNIRNKK